MLNLTRRNNERDLEKELAKFWLGEDFGEFFTKGSMKTDIVEDKDKVELKVELAGFKKEDINIDFENGYLQISAKREIDNNKKYHLKERGYSELSRTYYLGDNYSDDVKATLVDGLLTITLNKVNKPVHTIEIQ